MQSTIAARAVSGSFSIHCLQTLVSRARSTGLQPGPVADGVPQAAQPQENVVEVWILAMVSSCERH